MSEDIAAQRGDTVTVSGVLPKLKPEDAKRIGVFLVRGKEILAQSALDDKGAFRISIYRQAIELKSAYPVETVVGPLAMGKNFDSSRKLPTIPVDPSKIDAKKELVLSAASLDLSDDILRPWWLWCRNYCVSGTVVGANGCPVPGALVTVSSVLHAANNGFTVTPQSTVTADSNGHFTACFEWCSFCYGWPCWPIWWDCWPWWWEWDILRVLQEVEARLATQPAIAPVNAVAGTSKMQQRITLPLKQPPAAEMMIGQGFTNTAQIKERVAPDPARTAQIKAKFADPRIRAIFPWWWWCCENPNILFTVTQGATTIVAENPATDTRWCFATGGNVTLVGNKEAVTACGSDPRPAHGFVWTRVGNTLVDHISNGYAMGNAGDDDSDMAFTGTLDIFGEFAPGSPVSYYQVLAGDWSGDPARGGTAPSSPGAPIGLELYNKAFMLNGSTWSVEDVKMGPFSANGLDNLYATEEARSAVPTTLLPAFPAGSFAGWAFSGRKVYADASSLAGGSLGGVTLSVAAYNSAFAPVPLPPNTDDILTLEIDTNGLSMAHINSFSAYDVNGNPVTSTSGSDQCPAFNVGVGGYVVLNTTVIDNNGHLSYYELVPNYGHNLQGTAVPGKRGYKTMPFVPVPSPGPYSQPDVSHKSFVAGTENITFHPTVDCCYSFNLIVQKRCTDGTSALSSYTADFWTATIKAT